MKTKNYYAINMEEIKASDLIRLNPKLLAEYKVLSLLATTNFGKVYKVTHIPTNSSRCMKVYVKAKMKKTVQNDFPNELKLLKDLDHPHIFTIFEYFEDESSYYLVSEFLSGGELFDAISKANSFPEDTSRSIIQQILYCVNYLHKENIVHRDIKPENIMLTQPNDLLHLKLIDFGTAKKLLPGQKLHEILGTAYYMAPEIFFKSYDFKADIWACGVILFILICGLPPFNAATDPEIHQKIREDQLQFSQPIWEMVSESLKDLIEKMLVKDPAKRITAEEAINHAWFKQTAPEIAKDEKAIRQVMKNIKDYQGTTKLVRTLKFFLINQSDFKDQMKDLIKAFEAMDTDKDGMISKEEFKNTCRYTGQLLEFDLILGDVDVNHNKKINFSEFLVGAYNFQQKFMEKQFKEVFDLIDADKNGLLSKGELARFFGKEESDPFITNMIEEVDSNKDGFISLKELMDACMIKIHK